MLRTRRLIVLGLLVAGCASSPPPPGEGTNPCATKGATYLLRYFEQPGGTCGALANQEVQIEPSGASSGDASFTCASSTVTGCDEVNLDCTQLGDAGSCSFGSNFTFATNGSSASGYENVECIQADASCASKYEVTAVRE